MLSKMLKCEKKKNLWCHPFYTLLTKYKKCEGWLNDCLHFKQDNFWNFEQSWPNRNFGDNLISWHGYLQDNLDLVLHNLQAEADGQPWSTIIINNLADHGLGKLCQTMVNHGWLRCYFTNLFGIKFCQTMVNHGWLRCHFTNLWLTLVLIKLCQTMVNHGWLRCHFTNLWLTMVWESFACMSHMHDQRFSKHIWPATTKWA